MPNQNNMEPTKEEFDNKTQLSQKKLQRYHVGLANPTKDLQTKDQAECFDDAKGSHASQSFIQDKEIKDIKDG